MRLNCPLCGTRDLREFTYYGASVYADRPEGRWSDAWDDLLHLRDNPAGETTDLWYHELGCSAWIEVCRNTVTHAVTSTRLVSERSGRLGKFIYEEGDLREIAPANSRPEPKGTKA